MGILKSMAREFERGFWVAGGSCRVLRLAVATMRSAAFRHVLTFGVGLLATVAASSTSWAQFRREYPPDGYYLAMRVFEEGEFVDAAKAFRTVASAGLRSTDGRWVDSICYHSMLGECFYQMGDLAQALEQYTAAINLFLAYPNWMLRIDFPPGMEPLQGVARRPITWGTSTRQAMVGRFSRTYPVLQGRLDNADVIRQGGVIALPEYMLVNVPEVVRCTALALRRRREIMGVTCSHDPLTTALVTTLGRRAPLNHWSQGWSDLLAGLAYASQGNSAQALGELRKSLSLGGQCDHPLTSTALIEIGRLSFEAQQYEAALTSFLEATYSAAVFLQFAEMEEAFRLATATFLLTGAKAMYPPLEPAAAWARGQSRFLEASLMANAAQNAAEAGNSVAAITLAEAARPLIVRTSLRESAVGARFNYAMALANYQADDAAAGDTAFAQLMAFQQRGSRRLFEIGLVDRMALAGSDTVPARVANDLYDQVLREPVARDWLLDPVETLTVILNPPFGPLEHWFELTIGRKDLERAFEIADLIRRRRFFSTLPVGGRLLALRWYLEAPPEMLTEAHKLQRQELLSRFPALADLSRQSAAILKALKNLPTVPGNEDEARAQTKLFGDLETVSNQQEQILRDLALRRVPSDFLFPPLRTFKDTQYAIPEDSLVLTFLATSRAVYGMGCSQKLQSHWQLPEPGQIRRDLAELLRQMGMTDRNQPVDERVLVDDSWQEKAIKLCGPLTNNAKPDVWGRYRELVIVPDGVLWYVPFEAMPVVENNLSAPLISKIRIRYVPMFGLVPPDPRGFNTLTDTAIVAGQLLAKNEALTATTLEKLKKTLDRVSVLPPDLQVPSHLFAARCNRLLVLADIEPSTRGPYDWAPLPLEGAKTRSPLSSWLALPWEGPQQLVLPGFHTSAESALRRGGTGEDLFLAACALMASGTRTALISRWRPGGQTSYELMREFVQELPYSSAPNAWQRSVQLAVDRDIDLDAEPRIKADGLEVALKAKHPFFWSGFLLLDAGNRPKEELPAGAPVAPPPLNGAKPAEKPGEKPDTAKKAEMPVKPDTKPAPEMMPPAKLPPDAEKKPPQDGAATDAVAPKK
jgi:tetratricopeptide (TPR) repeat protein